MVHFAVNGFLPYNDLAGRFIPEKKHRELPFRVPAIRQGIGTAVFAADSECPLHIQTWLDRPAVKCLGIFISGLSDLRVDIHRTKPSSV